MQGLKLVAVAIVAQAVIGMGKKLTNTTMATATSFNPCIQVKLESLLIINAEKTISIITEGRGILGGIISFIGFTLPSVIILMVFSALIINNDSSS
jgi:chromate transport protein ChrA